MAEQAEPIARLGCPYGSSVAQLVKRANPPAGHPIEALVGSAERQFRAMGRGDGYELAVEFVAAYQGSAILASALRNPKLRSRRSPRLQRWIDTLTQQSAKPCPTSPPSPTWYRPTTASAW